MIKRLFDITAATAALVILSPVYAITAYKVKKNLGSPVIFRQTRPGLNGKPFEMIKFRSMKNSIDTEGNPLEDDERLTAFGKTLRNSSLDELPELWNVIKGDMSLVGPRPLLMEYLPYIMMSKRVATVYVRVLRGMHKLMVAMRLVGMKNLRSTHGMSIISHYG